jgi:hypothetical protein
MPAEIEEPTSASFADVERALVMFARGVMSAPQVEPQGQAVAQVSVAPRNAPLHRLPLRAAPPGVQRSFANLHGLYLPRTYPMLGHSAARRAYFAATAHLLAHVRHGARPESSGSLKPIARILVSLLEDARVESLLARELPGLNRLWSEFQIARPSELATFAALCSRLSRALFDPTYADPHPLIVKARALFWRASAGPPSHEECRRLGSLLGNDVGQMRLTLNVHDYAVMPVYRDDHQLQWLDEARPDQPTWFEQAEDVVRVAPESEDGENRNQAKSDLEGASGESSDTGTAAAGPESAAAGAAAEPVGAAMRELELQHSVSRTVFHPEWDYVIRTSRPAFCTVHERRAETPVTERSRQNIPDQASVDLRRQLQPLARRLKLESIGRVRRQTDGDVLDLDAAIDASVDLRLARTPDDRVYARTRPRRQTFAVLLLLDLSESTGDRLPSGASVLDLERRACLLWAELLARAGDAFAIAGFSSNGRHEVEYHRFKDVPEPWSATHAARLEGLTPRLSTRMGAALRHAGRDLRTARQERRLVLLLTDGEPSDIDAPDPRYLREDARHAVAELRRQSIQVFGLSVDPAADGYVRPIFGEGRYWVLDRIESLPQVLLRLYARLAK